MRRWRCCCTAAGCRWARRLREAIPGSELHVLSGLRHGELSMGQPEEYARRVLGLLEAKKT